MIADIIGYSLIAAGVLLIWHEIMRDEVTDTPSAWSPSDDTLGDIITRLNEEETEEIKPLTLHESSIV